MVYKEILDICYVVQEHCRYLLWSLFVLEVSGVTKGIATPFSLKGSSLGMNITMNITVLLVEDYINV